MGFRQIRAFADPAGCPAELLIPKHCIVPAGRIGLRQGSPV